jgi:hypothetical protein
VTVAYVKNADGSGGLCQNTFRDSAGTIYTLTNFYTDDAGVPHQVFFVHLPTPTPKGTGRRFRAQDSRIFIATDQRTFKV